jgi:hypothetical protein
VPGRRRPTPTSAASAVLPAAAAPAAPPPPLQPPVGSSQHQSQQQTAGHRPLTPHPMSRLQRQRSLEGRQCLSTRGYTSQPGTPSSHDPFWSTRLSRATWLRHVQIKYHTLHTDSCSLKNLFNSEIVFHLTFSVNQGKSSLNILDIVAAKDGKH